MRIYQPLLVARLLVTMIVTTWLTSAAWAAVRSASGASDKPIRNDLTLALRGLQTALGEEELREAIRATLIEWALR